MSRKTGNLLLLKGRGCFFAPLTSTQHNLGKIHWRSNWQFFPSIFRSPPDTACIIEYKSAVQNCWYNIDDIWRKTQNHLFLQIGGWFRVPWLQSSLFWVKFVGGKIQNFPNPGVHLIPFTLKEYTSVVKILDVSSMISQEKLKSSYF